LFRTSPAKATAPAVLPDSQDHERTRIQHVLVGDHRRRRARPSCPACLRRDRAPRGLVTKPATAPRSRQRPAPDPKRHVPLPLTGHSCPRCAMSRRPCWLIPHPSASIGSLVRMQSPPPITLGNRGTICQQTRLGRIRAFTSRPVSGLSVTLERRLTVILLAAAKCANINSVISTPGTAGHHRQ
jgi:hypothetical protein